MSPWFDFDFLEAGAGSRLEPTPIKDGDIAAVIADQLLPLELMGRHGDAFPRAPNMSAEKVMRSRNRADTFLNRCNPRLIGKNLFHQNALHFRILVRAAIGDNNNAVVDVRCMA